MRSASGSSEAVISSRGRRCLPPWPGTSHGDCLCNPPPARPHARTQRQGRRDALARTHRALHGLAAICTKCHSPLVLLQLRSLCAVALVDYFRSSEVTGPHVTLRDTRHDEGGLKKRQAGTGPARPCSRCLAGRTPISPKKIVAGQQTLTMRSRPCSRARARGQLKLEASGAAERNCCSKLLQQTACPVGRGAGAWRSSAAAA